MAPLAPPWIRYWGFSFKKLKIPVLYLNSQPTDSQSGVMTITPTEPTVSGRHRKAFSNLQSCMTDSSWIYLILLIQQIEYKIGKRDYVNLCNPQPPPPPLKLYRLQIQLPQINPLSPNLGIFIGKL